ncbi:putative Growth hormone-regulated TBC protein 1 [Paratrimastix pyriformis]|uniref:Growth hormone-regulated TBC protein 1 n=1 Tax=Paratrimastix pyriformis TaxID=342808 RepID=A0ABQ8UJ36_9EUKA|nr:putative Growth hormone-regulated TBC protein 1 [Paratrimastix pyriformis]
MSAGGPPTAAPSPTQVEQSQVRVTVLEARKLKSKDRNGLSDPVVYMKIRNRNFPQYTQTNHTTTIKKTLTPYWDEFFLFDLKMPREDFNHTQLVFDVYDANTVFRNELIGSYEFDLQRIHGNKGHEYHRQWIGITNFDKAGSEIQGYLRVSISALLPGEVPPSHEEGEDDEEVEGDDLQKMVLLPPQIPLTGYRLCLRCLRGAKLPDMDVGGGCDPFLRVLFGATRNETPVVRNNRDPIWNHELRLPVWTPTFSDEILVQLYDWDRASQDDFIASCSLRLTDVLMNELPPTWFHLYGPPRSSLRDSVAVTNKLLHKGERRPETAYLGRLLLSAVAKLDKDPQIGSVAIPAPANPMVAEYVFRCDLFQGSEFPLGGDRVQVVFHLGENNQCSKSVNARGTLCEFYQQFEDFKVVLPAEPNQLPDLIVDFLAKGTLSESRFGYLRIKLADIMGFTPRARWYQVLPDKLSASYKDGMVCGFLLAKSVSSFGFGHAADATRFKRMVVVKPRTQRFELRAFIYQGRNLAAADKTGSSDPYVRLLMGTAKGQTPHRNQTLFPLWYNVVQMAVDIPDDISMAQNLILQVWYQLLPTPPTTLPTVLDHDVADEDDMIGRLEIPVSKISRGRAPGEPKWMSLYMEDRNNQEGEVLAAFQLLPMEQAARVPVPDIRPPTKPCMVEVSVVGLRAAAGAKDPPSHPYIQFDLGELAPQRVTQPIDISTTQNHLQVLHFPMDLPLNSLYCPAINFTVFDKGLIKRQIGAGTIPLAPYLPWSNLELTELQTYLCWLSTVPRNAALLFTDGSFQQGQGGGAAAVLMTRDRTTAAAVRLPTGAGNGDAELAAMELAVATIKSARADGRLLPHQPVAICADSQYALGAAAGWTRIQFAHARVLALREALQAAKPVVLRYVPAHVDRIPGALVIPSIPGNQLADHLAEAALHGGPTDSRGIQATFPTQELCGPIGPAQWPSGPAESPLPFSHKFLTRSLLTALARLAHEEEEARNWLACPYAYHPLEPISARLCAAKCQAFWGVNQVKARLGGGRGSALCPFGCGTVETQSHLLGGCRHFRLFYVKRHDQVLRALARALTAAGLKVVVHDSAANARKATQIPEELLARIPAHLRHLRPDLLVCPGEGGPETPTVIELAVTTAARDEDLTGARDGKLAQYRDYCQAAGFDNRALLFGATGCIPGQSIRDLLQLVPGTEHKTLCEALRRISGDLTRSMLALFLMRGGQQ